MDEGGGYVMEMINCVESTVSGMMLTAMMKESVVGHCHTSNTRIRGYSTEVHTLNK